MRQGLRLSMIAVVAAAVCLIALLAGLQYRWLGRISDAERERLKTTLNTRAREFAQDVDRELTRAYLLFQLDPLRQETGLATQIAWRYDRWSATARFPHMLQEVYVVPPGTEPEIEQFDPASHTIMRVAWPDKLAALKQRMTASRTTPMSTAQLVVRSVVSPILEDVPAILVTTPMLITHDVPAAHTDVLQSAVMSLSYVILVLDREYMTRDMLPALAQQHFRATGDGFDYQLAVVRTGGGLVYHSDESFSPAPDVKGDAAVELFQVRTQDFTALASDVRSVNRSSSGDRATIVRQTVTMGARSGGDKPPISFFVSGSQGTLNDRAMAAGFATAAATTRALTGTASPPKWRLVVKHPAGSLEVAVNSARRRNLAISSGILAVLGLSLAFLVISTRRAQDLARQQLEFVATVSHELRTPLAVIRSAADNLAEGVIHDEARIRQYGDLVRQEGRRLSELVEQILEYAGLQSGQRKLSVHPVAIGKLLRETASSNLPAAQRDGIAIEVTLQDDLPAIVGDEPALRRVFQNLIENAVKYGAGGGWIGVSAAAVEDRVEISVADRGIGIAAAEQARIFDPFYRAAEVVAAQIQGAGLGLSLVRRIVEAHGGRITVKSAPGQGSTFVVSFPAVPGEAADHPERYHDRVPLLRP